MSRLDIKTPDRAQMVVDQLYHDMERRIAASPPGLCPVDLALNFLNLCRAQTCGKCVPCRIGLAQISALLTDVLDGRAKPETLRLIEETARTVEETADCAIGRHAARLVLNGTEGFRADYLAHIEHHRCLGSLDDPVELARDLLKVRSLILVDAAILGNVHEAVYAVRAVKVADPAQQLDHGLRQGDGVHLRQQVGRNARLVKQMPVAEHRRAGHLDHPRRNIV